MLTVSTGTFWSILGLIVGFFGAITIATGSVTFLRSDGDRSARRRERRLVALGAFLVAIAFALQLLSKLMDG